MTFEITVSSVTPSDMFSVPAVDFFIEASWEGGSVNGMGSLPLDRFDPEENPGHWIDIPFLNSVESATGADAKSVMRAIQRAYACS